MEKDKLKRDGEIKIKSTGSAGVQMAEFKKKKKKREQVSNSEKKGKERDEDRTVSTASYERVPSLVH